jgi:hypothetical protein
MGIYGKNTLTQRIPSPKYSSYGNSHNSIKFKLIQMIAHLSNLRTLIDMPNSQYQETPQLKPKVVLAVQYSSPQNLSDLSKDELLEILRHPSKASTKAQAVSCSLCQIAIEALPVISTAY